MQERSARGTAWLEAVEEEEEEEGEGGRVLKLELVLELKFELAVVLELELRDGRRNSLSEHESWHARDACFSPRSWCCCCSTPSCLSCCLASARAALTLASTSLPRTSVVEHSPRRRRVRVSIQRVGENLLECLSGHRHSSHSGETTDTVDPSIASRDVCLRCGSCASCARLSEAERGCGRGAAGIIPPTPLPGSSSSGSAPSSASNSLKGL